MTKKALAERLNIDIKTLKAWEESRPEVMKLIRLGLATEAHVADIESYLDNLKKIMEER